LGLAPLFAFSSGGPARARTTMGTTIESDPVPVPPLYTALELDFGRLVAQNLLRGARVTDGENGEDYFVLKAIDGDVWAAWLCRPGADNSTWTARLNDPVEASRLFFFSPNGDAFGGAEAPRVLRARVTINGKHELLFEPQRSAERPTELRFGQTLEVKSLAVSILEIEGGAEAGFGEIVLVR
jgi:hypothetical protein